MPFILPITQFVDVDGGPMSGWSVAFTDGQTNAALVAYKTAALDPAAAWGTSVIADSMGRLPPLWLTPTGRAYRATITFPDGRTRTIDGLVLDSPPTTGDVTSFAAPSFAVTSKQGTAVAIAAADFGSVIDIPSSAVAVVASLPDATSVPAGRIVGITSDGSGGVLLSPVAGQGASIAVAGNGATTLIMATGGGYRVIAQTAPRPRYFVVQSRTAATPPLTAQAGLQYLMPASPGTGYLANSVYESRGDGSFIVYQPSDGDEATILDEDETGTVAGVATTVPRRLVYKVGQWVNPFTVVDNKIATAVAASKAGVSMAYVRDQYPSGTSGSAAHGAVPASGVETTSKLNAVQASTITGMVLDGNQITLPIGTFFVRAKRKASGAFTGAVLKFVGIPAGTTLVGEPVVSDAINVGDDVWLEVSGVVVVTAPTRFELRFVFEAPTGSFLGQAASLTGVSEVFATVEITTLSLG